MSYCSDATCFCGGEYVFNKHCGALVCNRCDEHQGMARCYCGWSQSGEDGYMELEEEGEVIDE